MCRSKTTEIHYLTVLEARSLKSECQKPHAPSEVCRGIIHCLFLASNGLTSLKANTFLPDGSHSVGSSIVFSPFRSHSSKQKAKERTPSFLQTVKFLAQLTSRLYVRTRAGVTGREGLLFV